MGTNKMSNLKKCGDILIDINSKNRKNKIYIFHCTLCNLECDQLKKFSLHIGEEHLKDYDDILKEAELKFEAEPEEIRIQAFTDMEATDIKVFENSIDDQTIVNPDPLDTVATVIPVAKQEVLNCEIKHELKEDSCDEDTFCVTEVIDCAASIGDSDTEAEEKNEMANANSDTTLEVDSDSEDKIRDDGLDQIPLKKRKLNFVKKDEKSKQKAVTNELSSDESKDADYNAEKDSNAIKKHKRCKKRWMAKTAAERKRKQREKLKANGLFEELKKKEAENRKRRRHLIKQTASIEMIKALSEKKAEEMRRYRKRIKEKKLMLESSDTPSIHAEKNMVQHGYCNYSLFSSAI